MTNLNNGNGIFLLKAVITVGGGIGLHLMLMKDLEKSEKSKYTLDGKLKIFVVETKAGRTLHLLSCIYGMGIVTNVGSKIFSDMAVDSYKTGGEIVQNMRPR